MRARGEVRRDAGQVAPLLVVVVLVACGAVIVLGRLGVLAEHRAAARTAADAAALAGAAEGEGAAREMAEANRGALESFVQDGDDVEVRVRVGTSHATARARRSRSPGAGLVAGGGDRRGLAPAMLAALARADAALGHPVVVVSGFRSHAEQQELYEERGTNPYPVAAPGTSAHERGLAVDVPLDLVDALRAVGPSVGLCQPLPRSDPVHFEPCPTSRG